MTSNLVSHGHKNSQKVNKPREGTKESMSPNETIRHVHHGKEAEHEVTPIRLHKVMACNGRWVNMMLTKWTNEETTKQRIH